MRHVLLVYDIPQRVHYSPVANLRRLGFRINLSCWVLPMEKLGAAKVDEMRDKGASVEVVRFDEDDRDKIMRLAKETISRETMALHAKVEDALSRFAKEMADFRPGSDEDYRLARGRVGTALRAAKKMADDAQEAALGFGLLLDIEHLTNAVHLLVKAKTKLFHTLDAQAAQRVQGVLTLNVIRKEA